MQIPSRPNSTGRNSLNRTKSSAICPQIIVNAASQCAPFLATKPSVVSSSEPPPYLGQLVKP